MQPSRGRLAFLIARRLIQDGQHAADQQAEGIMGGEPVQHIDHLCDVGRIHLAAPAPRLAMQQ